MTPTIQPLGQSEPFTVTVRSLRARKEGAEIAVTVVLSCGEHRETRVLPITVEQYRELDLRRGEIDEDRFESLERASRLCSALHCGENLLTYGANSVKLLATKIMRHGYTREEATAAAEKLQNLGLIDEESDMRREVEKCLRKLWGAGRIRAHLWERGFGKETVDRLEELLAEVDFAENCAAMIRKHHGGLPEDRDELRRLTASLYRYGYRSDEIRRAFGLLKKERY